MEGNKEGMESGMHTQWWHLVMDYSRRGITKTTDRLIVLDGIAQALLTLISNRYLAGLWLDQLLSRLMWSIPWNTQYGQHLWDQEADPTTHLQSSCRNV